MRTVLNTTVLLLITSLLCAVVLSGCTKTETPSYSGPSAKVIIGVAKGESAALLFGAERLGYFKQLGLEVTFKVFDSGVAAVAAMHEKQVDLAAPAEFVIAANVDEHPGLRIIASINKIDSIMLIARKDRGIATPADLKGKRIAVTLNSIAEYFLGKYLSAQRLTQKDVTMVNMPPSMMAKELAAGNVDAVIVWNPFAQTLEESLGNVAVSWPVQGESRWHLVLVTREDVIAKNPEAMVRLLRTLVMAETAVASDPASAQKDLATRFNLPEKYFAGVWEQNRFRVTLDRSLLLGLEEQSRWISKSRGNKSQVEPNYLNFLYLDALKAVRPESVTIIN